jgi:uncharacterized protein (TIGR02145 family)
MKNFLIIAATALIAFNSCKKETEQPIEECSTKQTEVKLTFGIDNLTSGGIKQTMVNDKWEATDEVGLYMLDAGTKQVLPKGNNIQLTPNGQKLVAAAPVFYPDAAVKFVAYYPYVAGDKVAKAYRLDDQSAALHQELLWSNNITDQQPTNDTVKLIFKHILAKWTLVVNIADENFTAADISNLQVSIEGAPNSVVLDPARDEVSFRILSESKLIKTYKASTAGKEVTFQALVPPFTVANTGDVQIKFQIGSETIVYNIPKPADFASSLHHLLKFTINADALHAGNNIVPRIGGSGREIVIGGGKDYDVEAPAYAVTNKVWHIVSADETISQTWSDEIHVPACNKTDITFGNSESPTSDCMKVAHCDSYYYTWTYVNQNAKTLCPDPWRVPTETDFINLDIALGGTGINRTLKAVDGAMDKLLYNIYQNVWGAEILGYQVPGGGIGAGQIKYWSSDRADNKGKNLALTPYANGDLVVAPSGLSDIWRYALAVRCVK